MAKDRAAVNSNRRSAPPRPAPATDRGPWFALCTAQTLLAELEQAMRRYREDGVRPELEDLRWMRRQWNEAITALERDLVRRPLPGQTMLALSEEGR